MTPSSPCPCFIANPQKSSGPEVPGEMLLSDRGFHLKFMRQSQTKISVWRRQEIMTMAAKAMMTTAEPHPHQMQHAAEEDDDEDGRHGQQRPPLEANPARRRRQR